MSDHKKTATAHFIMAKGRGEKWQCPCKSCNHARNRLRSYSQEEREIFALCYILGEKISQKKFEDIIGNDKAVAALLKQKHEQAVAKFQNVIDLQKQQKEPDEPVGRDYSGDSSYQTGGGRRIIRDTRGLS